MSYIEATKYIVLLRCDVSPVDPRPNVAVKIGGENLHSPVVARGM